MIQAKCIEKVRDAYENVTAYILQSIDGTTIRMKSDDVRNAIFLRQLEVGNIILTKDGKLRDSSEKRSRKIDEYSDLKKLCKHYGVSESKVTNIKIKNPNLSYQDIITELLSIGDITSEEKCRQAGVSYKSASTVKCRMNMDSIDDAIQYLINNKENRKNSFSYKCKTAGVNRATVISFMKSHPEFTEDEAIAYYVSKKNI